MLAVIAHRGPDNQGLMWFGDAGSGLGHRRLSIIDLSAAAHQPMSIDDGAYWITFNGEIYNFMDVKRELSSLGHAFHTSSDTEVVLTAFKEWGAACLGKLNGMFAMAIYDRDRRRFFLARDRIGIKPLYYSQSGDTLIFASEIKAIIASGLADARPDYAMLQTPTRYQISPYTGFENIFKLPPGHCLWYSEGKAEISRYWGIQPSENTHAREEEVVEEFGALLADAVSLQMIADVPVGVFLSGGLDSSIISALMRKNTSADIHAFTIKFSDKDQRFEKIVPDYLYARKVAEQFGFIHHEFEIEPDIDNLFHKMIWHLDEPLTDPATINTYLISKAARDQGIVVLLNGMGGDEVFGGYRKQLACLKAEVYQSMLPGAVRTVLERAFMHVPVAGSSQGYKFLRWARRFLSFASQPQTERFLMSDLSLTPEQFRLLFKDSPSYGESYFYKSQQPNLTRDGLSYLTRMCLNDTNVFLPEHNLTYSDKSSMAASVESRPPLTDHRLVEYMFGLPPSFRIKGNVQKYLLKKASGKYLPNEIIHRPKAPFGSPLRSWVRGALAPAVDDILSDETLKKRGLYNVQYVRTLIDNDRAGLEDNALIIWNLLTIETWFRTFFGN
jgi:asparagine synthase (glutamine-hydrolysing)